MKRLYKKADALVGFAAIVLLVIVAVLLFANFSSRECNSNKDCGSGYYCGVGHTCHPFPTQKETIVKTGFVLPSIIIGISLIAAAWIFKGGKLNFWKESEDSKAEPEEAPKEEKLDTLTEPEEYYKEAPKIP